MNILDYVPKGFTLRDNQAEILVAVAESWDDNELQIILSDVGTGKSLILQTIARWQAAQNKTVATITPRVALQDQYKESFPDVPILKGSARYTCRAMPDISCKQKKADWTAYCKNCTYIDAKRDADDKPNAIFNLQSYTYFNKPRDVVLVDEAHTLFSQLSERYTLSVWQHKIPYPDGMIRYLDVLIWIEQTTKSLEKTTANLTRQLFAIKSKDSEIFKDVAKERAKLEEQINKLAVIYKGIQLKERNFFIEHAVENYRGKQCNLMRIRPTDLTGLYSVFSQNTTKMILATATFSTHDLRKLGLSHKTHKIHTFESPLGNADRPVVLEFAGNMSFKYQDKNIPKLANKLVELQARHSDTKGLVHVTYGMIAKLQKYLGVNKKFMWHTKDNKDKQLEKFRAAPPGTVFMAAGMSMGIDLAGPDFGWQAIAKIVYPNKSDPLIDEWYRLDRDWITWLTIRDIVQAAGRVNRYKGDYAVTYILDLSFGNPAMSQRGIYQSGMYANLWPSYFTSRIQWGKYEHKRRDTATT